MHHNKPGPAADKKEDPCACPFCDDYDCPIPVDACKSKPEEPVLCPDCKKPLPKGSNICLHCTTA